ncbi:LytR/AlgR family response regulator transcription factor [Sphingopyxis panaciterrae]
MTELTVAIVDDEPLALRRLELILARLANVHHVGSAGGCVEGQSLVARTRPDVLLLDIRMRDGNGFDLLETLDPEARPAVIFVTAFDHFAIRAFEAAAVDYVLKPIEPERLENALARARDRLASDNARERFAEMQGVVENLRARIAEHEPSDCKTELWVRGPTGSLSRISLDAIDWVSSEDDYIRLHTRAGTHLLRLSIRGLERQIDPHRFVRVHRRALVRIDSIVELNRTALGRNSVLLGSGELVPTGRIYLRQLRLVLDERRQAISTRKAD